jgi:hypothetical protein
MPKTQRSKKRRATLRAQGAQAFVQEAARRSGLVLKVNHCKTGNVCYQHWMFNAQDGTRLLDWWPGTGTRWSPATARRGHARDCWAALRVAKEMAGDL